MRPSGHCQVDDEAHTPTLRVFIHKQRLQLQLAPLIVAGIIEHLTRTVDFKG